MNDEAFMRIAPVLCGEINLHLRVLTDASGFARARETIPLLARNIAPGWEYLVTTEPGDQAPTVSLISSPRQGGHRL